MSERIVYSGRRFPSTTFEGSIIPEANLHSQFLDFALEVRANTPSFYEDSDIHFVQKRPVFVSIEEIFPDKAEGPY